MVIARLCIVVVIALSTLQPHCVTAGRNGCPPFPVNQFHWLNPDRSLINPWDSYYDKTMKIFEEACGCCEQPWSNKWKPIHGSLSCKFCSTNNTVVCQGSDIYSVPTSDTLPISKLFLFKLSGIGLILLPQKIFKGLSIQNLVIENTHIYELQPETFSGVKSIESIFLRNNMIFSINHADYLFQSINNLKFLSLGDGNVKGLSSSSTANLHNLTYFSLAGNTLNILDVSFLHNSGLTFLDLRNITFKLKDADIGGSGLNKMPTSLTTIDLSRAVIPQRSLERFFEQLKGKRIKTLNLSYIQTHFRSFSVLRQIKNSLQYLSLSGTNLKHMVKENTRISNSVMFFNLKHLNLENCNMSFLYARKTFRPFPNLTSLSLAYNSFIDLDIKLFSYLPNLIFINLSNNKLFIDRLHMHNKRKIEARNLLGADISNVSIFFPEEILNVFFAALKSLQILSLCNSTISYPNTLLNMNNLKYLDLSAAFSSPELRSIFNQLFSNNKMSLTELKFSQNNFKSTSDFPNFFPQLTSLESLNVSGNLIRDLTDVITPTLKTLDASQNLITTWYFSKLNNQSQLKYIDVSNNQITYVSDAMIKDFYKLEALCLDSNPLMCHNKVVALVCSNIKNNTQDFVNETQAMKIPGTEEVQDDTEIIKKSHTLMLLDWKYYKCYDLFINGYRHFTQEKDCCQYYEEVSTTPKALNPTTITEDYNLTTVPYNHNPTEVIIQPPIVKLTWHGEWTYITVGSMAMVTVLGAIVYVKWWNIRCFFQHYNSKKKVSLLRKSGNLSSRSEIYYDVFVSYSDVDRVWVLENLVPNMERDGDVSLCFHERDFQVGMSILENIIDCMDRSHALLLVVSSAFIFSKWCQFEMHLAQSRMIETFKDQLVLVLLEDIPRKKRPQTLHQLMMTKTYLTWPQQPCKNDAYELFWCRLKRSLSKSSSNFI